MPRRLRFNLSGARSGSSDSLLALAATKPFRICRCCDTNVGFGSRNNSRTRDPLIEPTEIEYGSAVNPHFDARRTQFRGLGLYLVRRSMCGGRHFHAFETAEPKLGPPQV